MSVSVTSKPQQTTDRRQALTSTPARSFFCFDVHSSGLLFGFHLFCVLLNTTAVGTPWCDMDTGLQTIVDGNGYPHSVYVSFTRDGSVWVRAGTDHKDRDWTYIREREHRFQDILVDKSSIDMIKSFNYTDYCVLSDIDLVVKAEGGWHPSYINVYNPDTKRTMTMRFRHKADCYHVTNISLTLNKQGLMCDGGQTNTCGVNNLPDKERTSQLLFLRNFRFDPKGPEHHICPGYGERNSYSFMGSYYHVYIKMAQCIPPRDSRTLGYEAKLRPHRDTENTTNTVIIPDPSQRALSDATVKGWRAFVKIVSLQHEIYLQVWRPSPYYSNTYTLVGQTYFAPRQLRFHEVAIDHISDMINVKRGDVLGLYFPKQNPIGWSSVPCAGAGQTYRYLPSPANVMVGKTFTFRQAGLGDETACRHYAVTAVFANKTDEKLIEDWTCPTTDIQPDTRKRSELHNSLGDNGLYTRAPGVEMLERVHDADGTIPVHIILIIIGCLLALLMVIGFISYYKAIRS